MTTKQTKQFLGGEYTTPKARIVVIENEGPLCASFRTMSIANWELDHTDDDILNWNICV